MLYGALEDQSAAKKKLKAQVLKAFKPPWGRLLQYTRPEWGLYMPAMIGSIVHGAALPVNSLLLSITMEAFFIRDPSEMMRKVTTFSLW